MVAISNLEANCGASQAHEDRRAMIMEMARDHFPGTEPDNPGKHGMPAGESSSGAPSYKRAKISEPTRNDYLVGRRSSSDCRPSNVHRTPEMSHSDALTLPRDRLEGILKKTKPEETPKEDPKRDFDIQVPLNDTKDILPYYKKGHCKKDPLYYYNNIKDVNELVEDPDDIDAATSLIAFRVSRHSFLPRDCVAKGDRPSSSTAVNADEPPRSSVNSPGGRDMRLSDTLASHPYIGGLYSEVGVATRGLRRRRTA